MNRDEKIKQCLDDRFPGSFVQLVNESHLHIGHPGAKSGLGHYAVTIKSHEFKGLTVLASHRLIYDALGELMITDIHALSIKASDETI